uniref:Disease resistance protein At4g27190 family n=1 Tax=Cajanus cajan TaxID=3821 RepID=A0A151RWU1_CAJCA|nr:Disease resistance protein At4g27190 family [Cajanus cajan]
MEFASTIVERVTNFVLDLSVRHVAYIIRYGRNIDDLNGSVKDLGLQKERVDHQRDEAEKNLKQIEGTVKDWFQKVDEFETRMEGFGNDEGHRKTGLSLSNGLFLYLRNRHRLSRQAKKMTEDVRKLLDESSKFNEVSYQQNVTSNDATMSNVGYVEFCCRKSIIEDIMVQLEDSTVRMIGLHGPGGVGKSTLIKAIANKARDRKLFNVVVIVEITIKPNPQKIQEEIAYVLGLRLEGEGETVRADCLRRRLRKEKENTLLILDDLWDRLDLNKLEKSLGDYKGCKILLTSRKKEVLCDHIKDDESIFCVQALDDKDALALFQKEAGIPIEMSNPKQEIVKTYCAGIPMAIVTVGRALRNKSELVWEATLEKLKKQELVGVHKSMEISVKMSYDHLENEELKSIFLLCAQMGHKPLIMDLVKYCFGLGILEGVYSLRDARERICTSIQMLKDSSLIGINCSQLKFFQIDTDDPSLKIPNSFFERKKKLRVLILTGFHLSTLPSSIKGLSNLRMLCLEQCTLDGNLSIIGKLKKLRILSFSGSQIENLPIDLGCLDKLQLLDISNCSIVEMIPRNLISRLTCLEELYIRKSLIKTLVKETNQSQISFLSELKHLHQLKVVDLCIPCATVLPKDLFFDKLNDYKIVIGEFKVLLVGDFRMPNKYEEFRSLALQLKDGTDNIHSQKGIKLLFRKVENLLLGELNGVQNGVDNVIYELNLDGFPDLKHLSITNNTRIKYINSMDLSHPREVFPNLKSLCLYKLKNIEMICCSPVTGASFTKLRTIKVEKCDQLKNLFSSSMVKFLVSLETIDVSTCDCLKEIVEILVISEKVEFLKLQSLTLQSLPLFASFYIEGLSVPQTTEAQITNNDHIEITIAEVEIPNLESLNLSSIHIHKIWSKEPLSRFCFQNLIKLVVNDCDNLRYLCSLSVANNLKNLKGLFISECPLMEKIFEIEGNTIEKNFCSRLILLNMVLNHCFVCIFPKLEEIHISEMKMLTNIWQIEVSVDSFSSLVSVHIEDCEKLDKIFPSHMEGWFESLDNLKVVDCNCMGMMEIVAYKDGLEANNEPLEFPELLYVELCWLSNIRHFCKGRYTIVIPNLECIQIDFDEAQKWLLSNIVKYHMQHLKELSLRSVKSGELLCRFLHRMPNLEKLQLFNSEHYLLKDSSVPCLGIVLQLKELVLSDSKIKDLGFERDPVLQRLEVLSLKWCQKLIILAPPSVSLTCMTYLEIEYCRGLQNLMAYSTAKSLVQLKTMKVSGCNVKEIVTNEGNEDKIEIVFSKLVTIELAWLPYLTSFCGFKKCEFKFPSLEILIVRGCNMMETFTMGHTKAPKLQNIFAYEGEVEAKWQWEGDLNTTIQKDFQDKLLKSAQSGSYLHLRDSSLQKIWLGSRPIPNLCFSNLDYLVVNGCQFLSEAILPFNLLPFFTKLQTLTVQNCSYVKTIFDVKCIAQDKKITTTRPTPSPLIFPLKRMTLSDLPNLENVWNEDPRRILRMELLEDVNVEKCESLTSVFPVSVTKDLGKLEKLVVKNCEGLMAIVAENNADPRGTFPFVKSLTLWDLPKFKYGVQNCSYVKTIFDVKCIAQDKKITTTRPTPSPLIFPLKRMTLSDLPNLENVWNEDPRRILRMELLEDVNVEKCESLTSVFPVSVTKDLGKLEKLVVKNCEGLMAIVAENNADPRGTFPFVKSLTLWDLPKFKYGEVAQSVSNLTLKDSPLQKIWQRSLPIPDLCFINLGSLIVDGCQFLSDVLPFDLLPFLINLEILEVRNCDSVKTIFDVKCTTHDRKMTITGPTHFLLILPLKKLTLSELPNLENVWNEDPHGTLKMQHLQQVYIDNCKCLTSVFPASVAKDLGKLEDLVMQHCDDLIKIVTEDIPYSRGTNLEPTFYCMTSLTLCDLPKFEYLDCINKVSLLNNFVLITIEFHGNNLFNLKVLTMSFHIGSIVFPCGFLQHVPNMENLVVCFGSFKEIFCLQSPNVDDAGLLSQLKVLILESLPELISIGLENTWVVPVLGNLESLDVSSCSCLTNLAPSPICFSNLMSLFVFECHGLENLFTSSTAKSLARLKIMEIKSCESIKEVVSKEEDESHEDEIIFWQLLYLNIESLPNLINFYKGSLSFPSLVLLSIFECHNMKTLCLGTINADKLLGVKFEKNADVVSLEIDLNYTTRKAFLAMVCVHSFHLFFFFLFLLLVLLLCTYQLVNLF